MYKKVPKMFKGTKLYKVLKTNKVLKRLKQNKNVPKSDQFISTKSSKSTLNVKNSECFEKYQNFKKRTQNVITKQFLKIKKYAKNTEYLQKVLKA